MWRCYLGRQVLLIDMRVPQRMSMRKWTHAFVSPKNFFLYVGGGGGLQNNLYVCFLVSCYHFSCVWLASFLMLSYFYFKSLPLVTRVVDEIAHINKFAKKRRKNVLHLCHFFFFLGYQRREIIRESSHNSWIKPATVQRHLTYHISN